MGETEVTEKGRWGDGEKGRLSETQRLNNGNERYTRN
jgi:hypothetical protein